MNRSLLLLLLLLAAMALGCTRAGFGVRGGTGTRDSAVEREFGDGQQPLDTSGLDAVSDSRVVEDSAGTGVLLTLQTTSVDPATFDVQATKSGSVLHWELGDGTALDKNSFSHTYAQPGTKVVTVRSADGAAGWTTLVANSAGLTGQLPPELAQLGDLEHVALYLNQFTGPIPAELGQLSKLAGLDISNNRFSGSIPAALGQLANLRALVLSNNELAGTIPVAIGQLTKLETLILYVNRLTGFVPGTLSGLTRLKWVDVSNNAFDQATVEAIINDVFVGRTSYVETGEKVLIVNGSNASVGAATCNLVVNLETSFNWSVAVNGC